MSCIKLHLLTRPCPPTEVLPGSPARLLECAQVPDRESHQGDGAGKPRVVFVHRPSSHQVVGKEHGGSGHR